MMPEQYRYTLPGKAGEQRLLGQLTGAACAVECAEIVERHAGLVVLITPDMQNALRLRDEIQQFTAQPVMTLPDWETLPYDNFSPHQEIISARLSTLYQLPSLTRGVLILPVNTLMQKVCPHAFLHGHALMLKKGQRLSRDKLRNQLEQAGYRSVDQVMEHGEFATRGALLDLFPMGSEEPFRIDFFDDEIDSLRLFDADTQRTLNEVEQIHLLPAREFPTDKTAIELFRSQWREQFEVRRDAEHVYQQVSKGTLPAGIEYWQSLFFSQPLPALFSYLPTGTLLVNTGDIQQGAERFWQDVQQRHDSRRSTRCARCCRRIRCGCRLIRCLPNSNNGRAYSCAATRCRIKPPISIWVINHCQTWRSSTRTNRRWMRCAVLWSSSAGKLYFRWKARVAGKRCRSCCPVSSSPPRR